MSAWGTWPPLPAPQVSSQVLGLGGIKTVALRVNTGATVTVVPAPPAGYFSFLAALQLANENTTLAMDWTLQDSDGLLWGGQGTAVTPTRGAGTDPVAGSIVRISSAQGMLSTSAISLTVNSGGPAMLLGYAALIPATKIVGIATTLSTTYQSLTAAIPTDAQTAAVFLGSAGPYGFLPSSFSALPAAIMNNDSANCTPVCRLTRGAFVGVNTIPAVTLRTRGSTPVAWPPLIQGDVAEIKLTAAPVIANSIVSRFYFALVALQP